MTKSTKYNSEGLKRREKNPNSRRAAKKETCMHNIDTMSEVMERIVVKLVSSMNISQETFKGLFINIISLEKF